MARFNTPSTNAIAGRSNPVIETTGETAINPNGGVGFVRTPKSELFLAAASNLNENSFYESADERIDRIASLVDQVKEDSEFLLNLITWLRHDAHMRISPIILAVLSVEARLNAKLYGANRQLIRAAVGRLDEVSDVLAFWKLRTRKPVPSAVKRGLEDVIQKKFNEFSYLKWRGRSRRGGFSLRDVLNIVKPTPVDERQSKLFKFAIDEAYDNELDYDGLVVLERRQRFLDLSKEEAIEQLSDPVRATELIETASLTHEVIRGKIGAIPAQVWANLVDHMGYTALRMNLRSMYEAGIDRDTIRKVNAILEDEERVVKSKTLPMQMYAAFANVPLDFKSALQFAATQTINNIPSLKGNTLVLIDHSGSMWWNNLSAHGSMKLVTQADIFGFGLALNAEHADVWLFGSHAEPFELKSRDLFTEVERSSSIDLGGTETYSAVLSAYVHANEKYDRVIIITDEQPGGSWNVSKDPLSLIDKDVPVYTWNLGGYKLAHGETKPNRYTFGGLSDQAFGLIPLIEQGYKDRWPWEMDS